MNLWHRNWFTYAMLASAIALFGVYPVQKVLAADADAKSSAIEDKAESVTVEPYTGPPIYLDEPETPPPPTVVDRQRATSEYPDGKLRWEREVARLSDNHFVADGYYREYYPDGKPFVEGNYKNGRQVGEWTYWHDNGTKSRQVTYKDGVPDGSWESHRADGTLEAKRTFKDGKREGEWIIYDDTGKQPLREEHYANGKPDGAWKLWYPSGQLHREITFKNGKRDGLAVEYREDGSKALEGSYADGKLQGTTTLLSTDGRKVIQEYEDGRLVSERSETTN